MNSQTNQYISLGVKEDVTIAFENFVKEFQSIDIVIGNAGIINEFNPSECVRVNLVSNRTK